MKVLAEQAEGKMNSRAEYPSNQSRQQRKRNVDNLTFSICGDTGFANPQLQIAPSSMKHSFDYIYNYLGICPRISLRIPAFAACGTFSSESIPQRKLHAMFILID